MSFRAIGRLKARNIQIKVFCKRTNNMYISRREDTHDVEMTLQLQTHDVEMTLKRRIIMLR